MIEYWLHFVYSIHNLTDAERDWLDQALLYPGDRFENDAEGLEAWCREWSVSVDDAESWPGCQDRFYENDGDRAVVLYAESGSAGDPKLAARLIQAFGAKFRPEHIAVLEYARVCSELQADGFGGGACVITPNEIREMDTSEWVDETLEELMAPTDEEIHG